MSFNDDEIRMIGHPATITIPGKSVFANQFGPELIGGRSYSGYIMGLSGYAATDSDTYIEMNDYVYKLSEYNIDKFDFYRNFDKYVVYNQKEATYENLRNICILLYNKISELEDRLNNV